MFYAAKHMGGGGINEGQELACLLAAGAMELDDVMDSSFDSAVGIVIIRV